MRSLDYIMGFASGMAGEELSVSWTSGYREGFDPRWLRGLLQNADGKTVGILELVFDNDLGSFAKVIVRKDDAVVVEILDYRGAWHWPLQVIAEKEKQLPYRGWLRSKPVLRITARRPATRRKVVGT